MSRGTVNRVATVIWELLKNATPEHHLRIFHLELEAAERKAVELLRSRLEAGSITVLNAKLETEPNDHIIVNGVFEDKKGNQRKFEVRFQIKQEQAQVVNWYVSS
jgi:hypothetical protein